MEIALAILASNDKSHRVAFHKKTIVNTTDAPLDMKGCSFYFVKCQIHPLISKDADCFPPTYLECDGGQGMDVQLRHSKCYLMLGAHSRLVTLIDPYVGDFRWGWDGGGLPRVGGAVCDRH